MTKLNLTCDKVISQGVDVEIHGVLIPQVIHSIGVQELLDEVDFNDLAIHIANMKDDERKLLDDLILENEVKKLT